MLPANTCRRGFAASRVFRSGAKWIDAISWDGAEVPGTNAVQSAMVNGSLGRMDFHSTATASTG